MNISILGSCQSRDIFNSKFVKNYKEHFNVYSYFWLTSMLSVMGEQTSYSFYRLLKSEYKDCLMEHWFHELEKPILKTLESKQPDVLLMDFYGDARYGAISYGSEYVVNRTDKLKDKKIVDFSNFGIVYSYEENAEDFILMWKNAFDRFMAFMREKLPDTQIIINTVKGSKIVTDDEDRIYLSPNIRDLDVDRINYLWSYFDNYAIKKYNLKALTFDKEYTLNPNYPFAGLGWALVHFHQEYYDDCFKKLLEATADIKGVSAKEININLVPDSAYKNKLRNWTNSAGRFEMVKYSKYNAIRLLDCREELGNYRPQVWSKPIEIIGDGKTTYTLSFYIKVPKVSDLEENAVIFAVRTFKYLKELKSAEAIDEYPLTIQGHNIQDNKEYRYTFTFKSNGKYLRVAPFMFNYVEGVEYSRIKVERSSKASEYSK